MELTPNTADRSSDGLYRYGCINRPPGFATLPSRLMYTTEPTPAEYGDLIRHGLVCVERPLTSEQVEGFELAPYKTLANYLALVAPSKPHRYLRWVEGEPELAGSFRMSSMYEGRAFTDIPRDAVWKLLARAALSIPKEVAATKEAVVEHALTLRLIIASGWVLGEHQRG